MASPFSSKPRVCFEIEKVIGVSSEGNVRSYQVQWAPAWISSFHLVGCEHLIQEFLQQQQTAVEEPVEGVEQVSTENESVEWYGVTEDDNNHEDEQFQNTNQDVDTESSEIIKGEENVFVRIKVEDTEVTDPFTDNEMEVQPYSSTDENESGRTTSVGLHRNHETSDITDNHHQEYSCAACNSPFQSEYTYATHIASCWSKAVSDFSKRPCPDEEGLDNSGKFSSTEESMKQHQRSHKQQRSFLQCSYCSKTFERSGDLNRHERIHTGVKPFRCDACGMSFTQKTSLQRHLQRTNPCVGQNQAGTNLSAESS